MGFRRFFKKDGTEAVVNKLKYYFLSKSGDLTEYADKATAEAAVSDPEDRIKLSGSKGDFRRTDDLDENITVLTRIKANADMSNVNLTNALDAEGYSGGADKVPYVSWNHAAGSLGSFAEGSSIGSIDCGGQSGIDGSAITGASVTAGSLPSGVTLASNGALSGTMPEQLASSTFTFTVSLTTGSNTSTREFTITNTADNDAPVWATSAGALTDAGVASYSVQLSASDPEGGSVTYSVVFGSLPSGLTMNSTGLISGIVSSWGTTSNFTVQITDSVNTADRSFSIASVNNPASWSTGSSIGEVSANSFTVSATDPEGQAITYSLYSGTLPSGMTLNTSTGEISGTNPEDGTTYSFTINAHDGYQDSTRAFTMSTPTGQVFWNVASSTSQSTSGGNPFYFNTPTNWVWRTSGGYPSYTYVVILDTPNSNFIDDDWQLDFIIGREGWDHSPGYPNYQIGMTHLTDAGGLSYGSGPTWMWSKYIGNSGGAMFKVQHPSDGTNLHVNEDRLDNENTVVRITYNASSRTFTYYKDEGGNWNNLTNLGTYTYSSGDAAAVAAKGRKYLSISSRTAQEGWKMMELTIG